MAKVLGPISACFKKGAITEKGEDNNADNKKNEGGSTNSVSNPGLLWRFSSQLYNVGSGAVGLGVGTVKWAASTTYTVGSGVVSATQTVGSGVVSATQTVGSGVIAATQTVVSKVVPSAIPKPKKE